MTHRREVTEHRDDDRTEFEVSEALTWTNLMSQAGRSSALYGGIAVGAGLALLVIAGLSGTPKAPLAASWDYFVGTLTSVLPFMVTYLLPVVALVATVAFGTAFWRRWRLATRYRIEIEDDRLRLWEHGTLGDAPDREVPTDTILKFQSDRVSDSTHETTLGAEATHEITMLTDDGMYTFAEGLEESEADRTVEKLQRAVSNTEQ